MSWIDDSAESGISHGSSVVSDAIAAVDESLDAALRDAGVEPARTAIVVGVSGGVDSAVLLHLLSRRCGRELHVAHVNYGLRGKESDDDELFVRRLAVRYVLPVHVARPGRHWRQMGRSLQDAARRYRYSFMQSVCRRTGSGVIAVGHNLDDQVETVLLNHLRGAGMRGLSGMPAHRPVAAGESIRLVRPLLSVARSAIEAYALAGNVRWRIDSSNARAEYLRNRMRHEVLPELRGRHGDEVVEQIARFGAVASRLAGVESRFSSRLIAESGSAGRLPIRVLGSLPANLQGRVILDAMEAWIPSAPRSRANAVRISGLAHAQVGASVTFHDARVVREREELVFLSDAADGPAPNTCVGLAVPGAVRWRDHVFDAQIRAEPPADLEAGPNVALLSFNDSVRELQVRSWAPGDRLQPLGMHGTKLVADVLTDAQVPHLARPFVPVVTVGGEIVWVVGHRIAEWAKVVPGRRHHLRLTVERIGLGAQK